MGSRAGQVAIVVVLHLGVAVPCSRFPSLRDPRNREKPINSLRGRSEVF